MVRLLLSALRERRGEAALLALLAALVVAAGVAGPLYADAAARNVVAASAAGAGPAERSLALTVEMTARNGVDVALAELRGSAAVVPQGPGVREIRGGYRRGAVTPADGASVEVLLAARSEVCAHLAVAGACPSRPGEVVLSADTAQRLGLATGGEFAFRTQPTAAPATLRVTGVYEAPGAAADPYWAGRAELTPAPRRPANPVFTTTGTLDLLGTEAFQATLDYVADLSAMSPADVDALARSLRVGNDPGRGLALTGGLSRLLTQVIADRDTVAVPVYAGAALLVCVAWWVLLLGAGHAAAERRTQAAMGALRGAPARHRAALVAGPAVLTVLLAAPAGAGLGWLLVRLLAGLTLDAGGDPPLTVTALAVAGALAVAVLASVVVVQVRAHRGGILDALRRVPARRGAAGNVAVLVAVVVAVAASTQLGGAEQGGVLPTAAPVLLLVAAGLALALAVRPLAGVLGRTALHAGHTAPALAALHAARRPGTDRLVALVVIVTALLGQAAFAWQGLAASQAEQARTSLGAARVVRVQAPSRAALLHLVRRADPDGAWAMAVAAHRSSGGTTVAVDSARLARVAYWPAAAAMPAEQVARRLRPQANPQLRVTGAALVLDVTLPPAFAAELPLSAVLAGPGGVPVTVTAALAPGRGRHLLTLAVPGCATGDGCRLAWLSFRFDPGGVVLHGIAQTGPDAVLADAASMADPARWRTSVGAEGRVELRPGDDGLTVDYEPIDARYPDPEVRVQVADAPLPLPAVLAGPARTAHDRTVAFAETLTAAKRPVDVVAALPALPGAGEAGMLVDLEYADRAGDSVDNIADLQVWLAADAPADAVDRLRAAGLVTLSTETAQQRADRLLAVGQGPGARFRLGAALLSVLLAVVAVALVAAVDGPRRGVELAALRTQGLPQRAVVRVARGGFVLIVTLAAAAGALLGGASGAGGPGPLAALLGAVLVLAGAAWAVGTRQARVTGLDLEEGR